MDCKHIVGFTDEGYEGLYNVEFGEDVYTLSDIEFYSFCPKCGDELTGDLVNLIVRKPRSDKDILSVDVITRESLRVLGEVMKDSLPFVYTSLPRTGNDTITIRKPLPFTLK